MKRIILISVVAIVTSLVFTACSDSSTKQNGTSYSGINDTTKPMNASVKYTCTMHPEVISDKPGECPKCGMTLVIKKDNNSDMKKMQMDSAK
jgi:hypothetical protein